MHKTKIDYTFVEGFEIVVFSTAHRPIFHLIAYHKQVEETECLNLKNRVKVWVNSNYYIKKSPYYKPDIEVDIAFMPDIYINS